MSNGDEGNLCSESEGWSCKDDFVCKLGNCIDVRLRCGRGEKNAIGALQRGTGLARVAHRRIKWEKLAHPEIAGQCRIGWLQGIEHI